MTTASEVPRPTTVADIMSAPVVTAAADESVVSAADRMVGKGVGSIVVVEDGQPVGIFTERDLLAYVASGPSTDSDRLVRHLMSSPLECVAPELELTEAWTRLAGSTHRHVPVVAASGELVGLLSIRDLVRVAQIRPITEAVTDVPRGLAGVVVAETSIGDVRGLEGFYHYRQYSAIELARTRGLEDVWHLLFMGHLPDREELEAFQARIRDSRAIPEAVNRLLPAFAAAGGDPLAGLRSAISACGQVLGLQPTLDCAPDELLDDAVRICAMAPVLVAALYRLGRGLDPIGPREDLNQAANYLYMVTGLVPDQAHARALEQYLMTTVDHGFNSSTFTARVISSTGADLGSALVGAIGALSGPLHGGAPSRALDMLDAIGEPARAEDWIRQSVLAGGRIMGFGHRVYKTHDPRSVLLKEVAVSLGGPLAEFAVEVERTVEAVLAELKPGRSLYANVEFYAGVVMESCGLPRAMFTPTFACSRIIGWCSHVIEQAADNRLIRPSARYVGPPPPQPVPPAV